MALSIFNSRKSVDGNFGYLFVMRRYSKVALIRLQGVIKISSRTCHFFSDRSQAANSASWRWSRVITTTLQSCVSNKLCVFAMDAALF